MLFKLRENGNNLNVHENMAKYIMEEPDNGLYQPFKTLQKYVLSSRRSKKKINRLIEVIKELHSSIPFCTYKYIRIYRYAYT